MVAHWPKAQVVEGWEEGKVTDFNRVQEVVRAIRNARTEKKVTPGKKISAIIAAGDFKPVFDDQRKTLTSLAHLDDEQLTLTDKVASSPEGALSVLAAGVEIYLPLAGMVDMDVERARMKRNWLKRKVRLPASRACWGAILPVKLRLPWW